MSYSCCFAALLLCFGLEELDASRCKLTDTTPFLALSLQLKRLWLSSTAPKGVVMHLLDASWDSLIFLDLSKICILGFLGRTQLPMLQVLSLSHCDLGLNKVRGLQTVCLPSLQTIDLSYNPLPDSEIHCAFNLQGPACSLERDYLMAAMNSIH